MIILNRKTSRPYDGYKLVKTWVMVCPECKSDNISSDYNPEAPANSYICVGCNHKFLFDSSKITK